MSKKDDDKLKLLCTFQHWLGSNYKNLPTDSETMTERSIKFLKEGNHAMNLFDKLTKNDKDMCSHPFGFVMSKCNGELNKCLLCGEYL